MHPDYKRDAALLLYKNNSRYDDGDGEGDGDDSSGGGDDDDDDNKKD